MRLPRLFTKACAQMSSSESKLCSVYADNGRGRAGTGLVCDARGVPNTANQGLMATRDGKTKKG